MASRIHSVFDETVLTVPLLIKKTILRKSAYKTLNWDEPLHNQLTTERNSINEPVNGSKFWLFVDASKLNYAFLDILLIHLYPFKLHLYFSFKQTSVKPLLKDGYQINYGIPVSLFHICVFTLPTLYYYYYYILIYYSNIESKSLHVHKALIQLDSVGFDSHKSFRSGKNNFCRFQ
uniref:DDE_Tnp_1_7 domain-containing protein n=1 Tax=Heterorhabditis bacteriophora TaxID=37862 RepID=A0A1I7WH29_HETBA